MSPSFNLTERRTWTPVYIKRSKKNNKMTKHKNHPCDVTKNEGLSISFLEVFFPTSPIISLIFMTSHGSFLTQFGLCPLRLPIQLIQVCIKILLPRHVATAEKKRKKWESNIKNLPTSSAPMINLKPPVLPTPKPYLTPSWRVSRRCPLRTLLDKSSKQWINPPINGKL